MQCKGDLDIPSPSFINQTVKLEEMEKKAGNAEGEVSGLRFVKSIIS